MPLIMVANSNKPAEGAFAITPSDTVNFTVAVARMIYVGGAGNVVVVTPNGEVVTLTGVTAGSWYPIRAVRVNSTSTTATNLVALY